MSTKRGRQDEISLPQITRDFPLAKRSKAPWLVNERYRNGLYIYIRCVEEDTGDSWSKRWYRLRCVSGLTKCYRGQVLSYSPPSHSDQMGNDLCIMSVEVMGGPYVLYFLIQRLEKFACRKDTSKRLRTETHHEVEEAQRVIRWERLLQVGDWKDIQADISR